ncbi:MAG: class I adenylate-forming enzyme family protein [Ilumatobacteraceae bacterium]
MPRLVAIDIHAGPEFEAAVRKTWADGDVVFPVDQRLPANSKQHLISRFGVHAIISSGETALRTAVMPLFGKQEQLVPLREGDALMIATSGSTGEPKGVIHTHGSLGASAKMVGERLDLTADDHWWLCIPAAHIGGFGVIARSLHFTSRITYAETIDQAAIQTALSRGATHTSVVPTLIARHQFDGWRTVLVGGASSQNLPENAIATYGMTETAGGVVYSGCPLAGVQVTVDAGELMVQTPSLARTYRNTPLPLRNGWYATGDLGRIVDGHVLIDGRKDDLIITGGVKVWPGVVESRLREHPLVKDAVVTGAPDSEWGAVVVAYVVCASPQAPSLDQLRNHVKETLSAAHAPVRLNIVDRIPRTTLGKVRRSELPGV